jgi:phosphoribosylamine--glycine ligase
MKTQNNIYLIEFNVRFGDPEALNVLKLLNSDFNKLSFQITDKKLKSADFNNLATVCTYLVPNGYPVSPAPSEEIEIEESEDIDLYYASVYRVKDSIRTTTSRSIALVGTGKELEEARQKISENISKIKGNLFYRKDIGSLL